MDSQTFNPVSAAHPGDTVLDYLDAFGWSQRELARRSGLTTKTVSEICNGKAAISTVTSLAFEKVFSRPAHFWINLQSKYDEITARSAEAERSTEWHSWLTSFPVAEMKKRGWLSSDDESSESPVFEMLRFLGVSSPESWDAVWSASNVAYRQTRKFKTNDYSMSAWVRATELAADELTLEDFSETSLVNSLDTLRNCSRLPIDSAFREVEKILSSCGVAFVLVPALPNTGISGCTRWLGTKKVIVALSLRYKVDDQIWFTLFHELGHVIKHRKICSFILDNADDNLTDGVVDPEMQGLEDEANRFAADTLIPTNLLNTFISFNTFTNETIHDFSEAIGVAPGIVVGRLQREGLLKHHQGNRLKQKVDWSFSSLEDKQS